MWPLKIYFLFLRLMNWFTSVVPWNTAASTQKSQTRGKTMISSATSKVKRLILVQIPPSTPRIFVVVTKVTKLMMMWSHNRVQYISQASALNIFHQSSLNLLMSEKQAWLNTKHCCDTLLLNLLGLLCAVMHVTDSKWRLQGELYWLQDLSLL